MSPIIRLCLRKAAKEAGRFEMKNCINFILFQSEEMHHYAGVIVVPFKKCLFQFPL